MQYHQLSHGRLFNVDYIADADIGEAVVRQVHSIKFKLHTRFGEQQ